MYAVVAENNTLLMQPYPMPRPAAQQVLIAVQAAGVNRADVMQRHGYYPPPAGASPILGLEVAGIIVELGAQVTAFKVGDRVCALLTSGGYSHYCLAAVGCCLPMLSEHSFAQAAALPEALFTVWSNLIDRANLQAGETLLIHGGSSGIGTMAIQLATALGARVIVTAGSAAKCAACLSLGAALAINYREENFSEVVKQYTAGRGVNVILDIVGGDYLMSNLNCLCEDGRLVQIATQSGHRAALSLLPVMVKRLTITGSTLRNREDSFKAAIAAQLYDKVWPLLAENRIKPVIDQCFALSQAEQAHTRLLSSEHIGKLILRVTHHAI